ncbi:GNAT family N-acetyltransferase [Colwellia sp. 4_MG-2023]|jgi:GNAT superfamily N-acetyltransferase|uniref:GNAT family N-acetyltransferase n=1 Tax=unclassified Colwellia TaxID=196834 RepID=UPI001C0980F4|nr:MULTISPECIES: GNAT family N-acetyltransferase [unclassified Colwellia]MBU2924490.1 GNAT family N-acetyltransferase [Colwellia sp. C2M11]MDO6487641.1 GNAT family N-acetyltransferase [Colwellia sp. 6_MG-2023]MDO6507370.1 GNAT family N-acetyltransferase [Colwellia sp. 5_MG-2023]MDO6556103.1 GNAT family N-acetyltransferase [Colwellia sp. 4_MG-2023]MDO6652901.1 GNAT family N-acetyltransferase [Colwellia sp. 3_MG-2023]
MKFTIGFRNVTHEDLDFLLILRKKSMSKHLANAKIKLTNEQHLERVKEHYYDSHIILRNRKPIGLLKLGIVSLNNTSKSLHIRQLQILPEYQGKGIGSKVLKVVKKKALQLQLPITLNVLLKNPARGLYLRHGFQIEGKNKVEFQMRCPLDVLAI